MVRRAKRKVEGFSDPDNIRKAKAELKAAQKKLKDFIDQTNAAEGKEILKRDYGREKIYGAPSPPVQSAPAPPVDGPDTPKVTPAEVTLDAPQAPPDAYRDTPVPEREGLIMSSGDVHESSIDNSGGSGIIEEKIYHSGLKELLSRISNKISGEKYNEVSNEYLDSLPKNGSPYSIDEALTATNPKKNMYNCQRCVPAYEMLRRGYRIHASIPPENLLEDDIGFDDYRKVFIDAEWISTKGNGSLEIENFLLKAGSGSRVEISLKTKKFAHLFVAENDNGIIRFIDPQTGNNDVKWYLDSAISDTTEFARIDNLKVSNLIQQCLEVEV